MICLIHRRFQFIRHLSHPITAFDIDVYDTDLVTLWLLLSLWLSRRYRRRRPRRCRLRCLRRLSLAALGDR